MIYIKVPIIVQFKKINKNPIKYKTVPLIDYFLIKNQID